MARKGVNHSQNNTTFINFVNACVHLSVLKYQLSLHTGDKENADSDGEIFVKLLGDKGNSCRHLLRKSNNEKMFQKGQVSGICLVRLTNIYVCKNVVVQKYIICCTFMKCFK